MVDSRAPLGDRAQRIAAADHQVTGIEAETDVGATQHFRDLVRSFNVTGAVVVQGRLVPTLPADAGGALHALGEPGPARGVEHQRGIVVRPAGRPAACLGTGIGQRGSRREDPLPDPPHKGEGVEGVQQAAQFVDRSGHSGRLRERHRDVAARQLQSAALEPSAQRACTAEIAGRPQVDAGVARALDRVEHGDCVRHMRIDANRDFEGPEADRGTSDGDRCDQIRRPP